MPHEPDDSNLKIHELVDRQGKLSAKGKRAEKVISDTFRASMKGGVASQEETPMITLKHRWMKNRNMVVGTTVFPFNDEGVAKIPNVANSSLDAAALVRQSHGLVAFVEEAEKEPVKAPEPVPEAPKPEVKEAAAPEPEKAPEPAQEVSEDKPQPPKRPGKKGPPRRPGKNQ